MIAYEYAGSFVPSMLAQQVRAAGIDCAGVTCTQDETGAVTAVQVVVSDETDKTSLDSTVAAYTPPPPPSTIATADDHAAASAAIVSKQLASVPVQRDQIEPILQKLLGEAAAAIPFFEKYALDPSMTSPQWTAFQALDQTTKDRLLYDAVRSLAALMRYLTGDLPTS